MKFLHLLPENVKDVLAIIQKIGYSLTAVGGSVRDFYKDQKLSKDLDFELRSSLYSNNEVLLAELSRFNFDFEVLPYEIVKIKLDDFDLEFSAPRIEEDIPGEKSHHHFVAHPNYRLSHAESFKRRDFTINAIGLEIDIIGETEVLVDPFNGLEDLRQKVLRQVGANFTSDYVRFLRLIRFSVKFDFKISDEIQQELTHFNLSHISKHYLKNEMLKSQNAKAFICHLFFWVKEKALNFDSRFLFLAKIQFGDKEVISSDGLMALVYLENDHDLAQDFCLFLGMSASAFREMDSFYKSYLALLNHNHELTKNQSFDEIVDFSFYKDLKNYFEKIKWLNFLNLTKLYSEELFQSTRVEEALMLKTSKEKRSFLKCFLFYKNAYETTRF